MESAARVNPSITEAPGTPQLRVGLAVPSLDQGRFLGPALDSVLGQTEVDLRVAVLDGGSRDESLAVIRRYESRLAYWRAGPDRGQAAAINEGIERLRDADYVGWLNADDLLLPRALFALAAYLDAHPGCVAVFGQAHIIDADGRIIGQFPTRSFTRRALARTSIICQPASLIARRAWEAVGGLDESLHMCLDYDLWWRLSKLGPVGYIRQFLACSRDHAATKTRAHQDRLYAEAFVVLRRHLGYVPWRWCLSETACAWREAHGGERAAGFVDQLTCAGRAARRHAQVNGLPGLINGFRELWLSLK
jgi:GT2 family glycosyltransferase